jgi:hypothetical protein
LLGCVRRGGKCGHQRCVAEAALADILALVQRPAGVRAGGAAIIN